MKNKYIELYENNELKPYLFNSPNMLNELTEIRKLKIDFLNDVEITGVYQLKKLQKQRQPKTELDYHKALLSSVNDDDLRPIMNGVHYDETGYMVATDAFQLVSVKNGNTENKTIDANGYEIEGNYPNWKLIIPVNPIKSITIDVDKFYNIAKYSSQLAKKSNEITIVKFVFNGITFYFRETILLSIATTLSKLGVNSFDVYLADSPSTNDRAITLKAIDKNQNEVTALLLPTKYYDSGLVVDCSDIKLSNSVKLNHFFTT